MITGALLWSSTEPPVGDSSNTYPGTSAAFMSGGARSLARCLLALAASGGGSVVVCRPKANTHTSFDCKCFYECIYMYAARARSRIGRVYSSIVIFRVLSQIGFGTKHTFFVCFLSKRERPTGGKKWTWIRPFARPRPSSTSDEGASAVPNSRLITAVIWI